MSITRCLDCGYDLKGLPLQHRCPECGVLYNLKDTTFIPDQKNLLTFMKYVFLLGTVGALQSAIFGPGSGRYIPDNLLGRIICLVLAIVGVYFTIKFWKKPHESYYLIIGENGIRWKSLVGDVQSYPWPLIRNIFMDKKTLSSDGMDNTIINIIVLDIAGKDTEIPSFTYKGCINTFDLYDMIDARWQKALDEIKSEQI